MHDEDEGDEQQVGGHDRDVDVLHGLQEQEAHAGPLEHRLGDDREGDDRAELKARDGDDRDQRVLQRVAEIDGAVLQAAGAGEADVVGPQHLQHLGPHEPHDERHLEQAERDGGQDERAQARRGQEAGRPAADPHHVAAPEGGQPAELLGEDVDQQDADQEGRQRDADERDRLERVGERRAAPSAPTRRRAGCRSRARRWWRRAASSSVAGSALGEERRDRLAELVGDAEIARHGPAEIAHDLHGHRIVEAERGAHLHALLVGRVDRDDLVHRIADEPEHREGDDADGEEDADGLEDAPDQEGDHAGQLRPRPSAQRRPGRSMQERAVASLLHGPLEAHLVVGALRHLHLLRHAPGQRLLVQRDVAVIVDADLEGLLDHLVALGLVRLDQDLVGQLVELRVAVAAEVGVAARGLPFGRGSP